MQIKAVLLILLFMLNFPASSFADNKKNEDLIVVLTDYSYRISPTDSQEKIRRLALFGAQSKAIALSAKYLVHKGLLPDYGKRQKEIYCLTADEISTDLIESKMTESANVYYVKIRAKIKSIDFFRAEIKDLELEKEEMNFSWQEELSG